MTTDIQSKIAESINEKAQIVVNIASKFGFGGVSYDDVVKAIYTVLSNHGTDCSAAVDEKTLGRIEYHFGTPEFLREVVKAYIRKSHTPTEKIT